MNIFFLDKDPVKSAEYHVTRHVSKIAIEANQLLSVCYNGEHPYEMGTAHRNHPMALWIRKTRGNFDYIVSYVEALCEECKFRGYKYEKNLHVLNFCRNNSPTNLESNSSEFTDPPRCFGPFKGVIEETNDIVADYRNYYVVGKQHLKHYKNREVPDWFV